MEYGLIFAIGVLAGFVTGTVLSSRRRIKGVVESDRDRLKAACKAMAVWTKAVRRGTAHPVAESMANIVDDILREHEIEVG